MRSLFIHDPADLDAAIPGGVQLCSAEFLEIVRAASTETRLLPVTVSRNPLWRIRRKLALGTYLFYSPEEIRSHLTREIATFPPSHIFLNRTELLRLAPLAAELAPSAKIIVMSHGNQSGDDLYEISGPCGRRKSGLRRWFAAWQLGLDLATESHFRHHHLDGVCVMSGEEETLERWLGAKLIVVLPRIIRPCPLDWTPVAGRTGYVGTLDHTPNRVALESLCAQLQSRITPGFELRLVAKYPFITYLGRLSDNALLTEITTWTLFLNPVFWLSRGASMKLGRALAWAVPAVTTRSGARGYQLEPTQVQLTADSAQDFAAHMLALLNEPRAAETIRAGLVRPLPPWPDVTSLAERLRNGFR